MKAVILGGGYATRLRPLSCSNPKLLFPIVGVPLLDTMVSWLKEAKVSQIILAVNHLSERLRIEVRDKGMDSNVILSVEESPLGTAGPLRQAKDLLDNQPLIVVNGDVVSDIDLRAMVRSHETHEADASISLVSVHDTRPYGSVNMDSKGRITKFQEKKDASRRRSGLINAGVYVLDPSVIDRIPKAMPVSMEHTIFPALAAEGRMRGWKHQGYWYDIGTIPDYVRANRELLLRMHDSQSTRTHDIGHNENSRQSVFTDGGSTVQLLDRLLTTGNPNHSGAIHQPSYIGERCTIQLGAKVGPKAILSGGVKLGQDATVRESIIFENTNIERGCIIDGALIGERVNVGPETRIGRGAIIAGEVNIPPGSMVKNNAVILS